ncbi:hypothetical protein [Moraxella catarrhalis]|nr:hypothetical protein [Moraxella catarrhalis]
MSGKVFISGSISIKHIPEKVKESLGKISQGNLTFKNFSKKSPITM